MKITSDFLALLVMQKKTFTIRRKKARKKAIELLRLMFLV